MDEMRDHPIIYDWDVFSSNMDEDEDEVEKREKEVSEMAAKRNAGMNTIDLNQLSAALKEDSPITEFLETHLGIQKADKEKLQGAALILLLGAKELSIEALRTLNPDEIRGALEDAEEEFSKDAFPDPEKYASPEGHAFYMDKFTKYLFEALESMQRYFRYNDLNLPTKNKKLQAGDPFFNNTAAISSCLRSVALHTEEHELNTDDLSDSARFYKNVHTGKVEEDRYHMILDNLSLLSALGNTAKGLSAKDKDTKAAYERQAKNEALDYSYYFSGNGAAAVSWDLHTGSIAYTHSLHPEMTTEEAQKELYKEHVKDVGKVFDRVKKTGLIDENTGSTAGEPERTEKVFAATGLDKTDDVKTLTKEQLDSCRKIFYATFGVLSVKETAFFANSSSAERTVLDGFYINGVKAVDIAEEKMYIYPDDPRLKKEDAHKEWERLEPYVCALVLQSFATSGGLSLTYKPFTPLTYKQDDTLVEKSEIGVKSEKPLLGQDVVRSVETQIIEDPKKSKIRKREDEKRAKENRLKEKDKQLRKEKDEQLRKEKEKLLQSIHVQKQAKEIIQRYAEEKKKQEEPGRIKNRSDGSELHTIKNRSDGLRTIKNTSDDNELGTIQNRTDGLRTIKTTSVSINREEEKQEEEYLLPEEDSFWPEEDENQKRFLEEQDNARAFVNRAKDFRQITSEIRTELLDIKSDLERSGRINKKEAFERDGSTSYKAMASALSKCIDQLGEGGKNISIKKIATELQKLKDAGDAYKESHSAGMLKRGALAIVGKKDFYHAYGQTRFHAAERLSQMQALINSYSTYTDMKSMSKLLKKSQEMIEAYDLDAELEDENDLEFYGDDDLLLKGNAEQENNIIAVDEESPAEKKRPKKLDASKIVPVGRKKEGIDKDEPLKERERQRRNNSKKISPEEEHYYTLDLNRQLNRDMDKNTNRNINSLTGSKKKTILDE